MEVDLGSFHRFMPKPECDRSSIGASLKEFHGRCVAQYVRRHFLFEQ